MNAGRLPCRAPWAGRLGTMTRRDSLDSIGWSLSADTTKASTSVGRPLSNRGVHRRGLRFDRRRARGACDPRCDRPVRSGGHRSRSRPPRSRLPTACWTIQATPGPRSSGGSTCPPVLLSGDHAKIAAWRREQSRARTAARRKDLLADPEPVILSRGCRGATPRCLCICRHRELCHERHRRTE